VRARLPLAVALVALALAPSGLAQVQANASMAIEGLSGASTNGTSAALPFSVRLDLSQFPCVGQGASMTVELAAEATGNATATVQPSSMTFVVPLNSGLTGYSHSQGGTVLVARPDGAAATNSTVTVTALMTEISGCATASTSGFDAEGTAAVAFLPLAGAASEPGPAMPAPGLGFAALALGAVAVALRRR
jgi:hypothetical protein